MSEENKTLVRPSGLLIPESVFQHSLYQASVSSMSDLTFALEIIRIPRPSDTLSAHSYIGTLGYVVYRVV